MRQVEYKQRPGGAPIDPERCAARVYREGHRFSCQCDNPRKIGRWCGIHSDEAIERRERKRAAADAIRKQQRDQRNRELRSEQQKIEHYDRLRFALERIANGDTKPRQVAKRALAATTIDGAD